MKILSLMPVGGVALLIAAFGAPRSTSIAPCRGPDTFSATQLNHLKFLMRTTDDLYISFRRRAHLPAVSDSTIQLVIDSATCARVVGTWNIPDSTNAPRVDSLYVIRVGSNYDAINPADLGGEWNQHMVVDSLFHHLADYLY